MTALSRWNSSRGDRRVPAGHTKATCCSSRLIAFWWRTSARLLSHTAFSNTRIAASALNIPPHYAGTCWELSRRCEQPNVAGNCISITIALPSAGLAASVRSAENVYFEQSAQRVLARCWVEPRVNPFRENSPEHNHGQPGTLPPDRVPLCLAGDRDRGEAIGARKRPLPDRALVHLRVSCAWKDRMATPYRLGVPAPGILVLRLHRRRFRGYWRLVVRADSPPIPGTRSSPASGPSGRFFRTNDRRVAFSRHNLLADV